MNSQENIRGNEDNRRKNVNDIEGIQGPAGDVDKMREGGSDEVNFDANVDTSTSDKDVYLDRGSSEFSGGDEQFSRTGGGEGKDRGISSPNSGDGQQNYQQQEQQQAGIPTQSASEKRGHINRGTGTSRMGSSMGAGEGFEGDINDAGEDRDFSGEVDGDDNVSDEDLSVGAESGDEQDIVRGSSGGGNPNRTSGITGSSNMGEDTTNYRASDQRQSQDQDDSRRL